jgi:hypothetical protein
LKGIQRRGAEPKPFPKELVQWIKDVKDQIKRTPKSEATILEALHVKLESLELERFGYGLTKRPSLVEAHAPVLPASAKPAEAMRKMTDADIQKLKAAAAGREPDGE